MKQFEASYLREGFIHRFTLSGNEIGDALLQAQTLHNNVIEIKEILTDVYLHEPSILKFE
ncbi:hypothetical protein NST33_17825 [Paenibacillus sp. FSL L8-0435]|uniref:hypothetical protein n=1 Tax=Paenibacillus TaxID=44249 RepID=UPI000B86453D|nr:hypothetical protein [Paenibacillus amylolyticus]